MARVFPLGPNPYTGAGWVPYKSLASDCMWMLRVCPLARRASHKPLYLLILWKTCQGFARVCLERQPRHKLTPTSRQRELFLKKPLTEPEATWHNLGASTRFITLQRTELWSSVKVAAGIFPFPPSCISKAWHSVNRPGLWENSRQLTGCHSWNAK